MSIEVLPSSGTVIDLTRLRWRFVICIASFYVNAIAWGFISSTGIFEDAFKTTYQLSSFKSTLPGSIQIATMSILSVFASVLTLKYGVRWTTVFGAFISATGSILAAVIGDYWAFCSFHGLLVGTGEALMLVPAVLAIPPYFHSSRVSFATASAVSGASIGMFVIPFLLQYLLDTYGLRGATLLGSCLWLRVCLSGGLLGKGVTSTEEESSEINAEDPPLSKPENEREIQRIKQPRLRTSTSAFLHSRRASVLPVSSHYCQQQARSVNTKLRIYMPTIDERYSAHPPNKLENSDVLSSSTNAQAIRHIDHKSSRIREISALLHINKFRVLIISMILIWSLDATNFLFLSDLLQSSGLPEQRSTLLIAITGIADLLGQLFFGYLGDIGSVDPLLLWTCTSCIAGVTLSIAPLVGSYGIAGLSILFGIHAFFLAAPNALGNVIMIEVVGIHRYAMAYGFSLLASGSTSLFGYPLLGLLKDKSQSWTIPFALAGMIMICGGLVAGTIPLYTFYQRRKDRNRPSI